MLFCLEARQLEDQIVTLSNGVSRQAPAYIEAWGGISDMICFFFLKGKEHILQGHPPQKKLRKIHKNNGSFFCANTIETSRPVVSTRSFFCLLEVSISFFSFRAKKVVFEPFGSTGSTGRSPFAVLWKIFCRSVNL